MVAPSTATAAIASFRRFTLSDGSSSTSLYDRRKLKLWQTIRAEVDQTNRIRGSRTTGSGDSASLITTFCGAF